ncbi:TMEM175 family protein [Hymenobacter psoromatis]|uniref:TMEM175 family protein n=1 Tax=Hymenobacter psoromatis TaxID=1484116 RepID=UPI001CBF287B|nr:TMEM175 family protein [Hymenobacter psoromatis]
MKTDEPAVPVLEEGTGRLEAFSDGIFGVAITLLALDLKAPDLAPVTNHHLLAALLERWPEYLSVLNSFASVLLMWISHHAMFRLLRKTDVPVMLANGLLLLLVVGVPYPASVLARYMQSPAAAYGVIFYCGYFVAVNLSFNLLWLVIRYRGHRLKSGVTPAMLAPFGYLWVSAPLYLGIAVVALFSPFGAVFLTNAMWVYWGVASVKMHRPA